VKPVKETGKGEAVEELKDCGPEPKLPGQGPPRDAVSQDIPKRVEMRIERCCPPSALCFVSVSKLETVELIFLAARGAAPA
jgi:hypothetical protein